MPKYWTVRVDYTVEADSMDEAVDKCKQQIDLDYNGVWSVEFDYKDEEENHA